MTVPHISKELLDSLWDDGLCRSPSHLLRWSATKKDRWTGKPMDTPSWSKGTKLNPKISRWKKASRHE